MNFFLHAMCSWCRCLLAPKAVAEAVGSNCRCMQGVIVELKAWIWSIKVCKSLACKLATDV